MNIASAESSGFKPREAPAFILAPDGTMYGHGDKWWDEPSAPNQRIPLERIPPLLSQIDEPGGRQSCYLTSQLNGWVMRGRLAKDEAQFVQDTVTQDPAYSKYWRDQATFGKDYIAWSSRPGDTAYAVYKILGRKVAFGLGTTITPGSPGMPELLEQGFSLVVANERHARVAIQPSGTDEVFEYDPKYTDETGLHSITSLLKFQQASEFIYM